LPRRTPLEDSVFNLQHVALLLAAVRDYDADALSEAAARQIASSPYRQPLVPQLRLALELQHPDLLGVCLGGQVHPSSRLCDVVQRTWLGRSARFTGARVCHGTVRAFDGSPGNNRFENRCSA
jgi:hypothetical protein